MKKLMMVCLLALCGAGYAQTFRCAFNGTAIKPVPEAITTEEAEEYLELMEEALEELVDEMGLMAGNYSIQPARNIRNMQAEFDETTRTLNIFYSQVFLENLERRFEDDEENEDDEKFEIVLGTILLHEIGHLLNGHVHGKTSPVEAELEADYFAGRWMAQFNIDLDKVILAYRLCASVGATETHPSRRDRIDMATEGYDSFESYHEDDDDY